MGSHNPNLSNDIYLSLLISILIALPLGVTLVLTRPGGRRENKIIYPILNTIEGVAKLINIQT